MYPKAFGKYTLEAELARGGMARVLLATLRGASGFEKKLVVKQIRSELAYDASFVRRFVEEAKTTVGLSHPNIVPVYELGVEEGTFFLAMEFVEGVSLAELLRGHGDDGRRALSADEGAYVGVEICRALEYAHRRMSVVHRDVTPRNVMIDEEGQVKVIDFGIAAPARVTGNEIFGSPGHMPPEQIEGRELGPATDVFAVAALLLEAWSGEAPFRRGSTEASFEAMKTAPKPASSANPRLLPLDAEISRGLSMDPKDRQQDIDELGRVLRGFLQGIDTTDIARALGARVRQLREDAKSQRTTAELADGAADDTAAQASETKTFAARQEVEHWKDPSVPPAAASPSDAPSTRRLPSSDAPPPSSRVLGPVPKAPRVPAEVSSTSESRPPRSLSQRPAGNRAWLFFGLLAASLVGVAVVALPGPAPAPMTAPAPGSGATGRIVVPTAPSSSTSANLAALAVPLGSTLLAPGTPPGSSLAPTAARTGLTPGLPGSIPGSVSAAPQQGRGSVSIAGEAGTSVSVDGVPRGPVPQRMALEPGPHEFRFIYGPTGESRTERITLKPGDRILLRSSFTGATPTVFVGRN